MAEPDFDEKCEHFLVELEELEDRIAATGTGRRELKLLERKKADIRRAFALLLRNHGKEQYQSDRWNVRAYWNVRGVPSQKAKDHARAWMETQNFFGWAGFAPQLRDYVARALRNQKFVPKGFFGLHVDWMVDVYPKRYFDRPQSPDAPN